MNFLELLQYPEYIWGLFFLLVVAFIIISVMIVLYFYFRATVSALVVLCTKVDQTNQTLINILIDHDIALRKETNEYNK